MKNILDGLEFKCRVSSVLNRNAKEYGKKFMFDNQEDSCWNSDQGFPQWIDIEFPSACKINTIKIQFQGGFVGQDCCLQSVEGDQNLQDCESFYPEDINAPQLFQLSKQIETSHIRLVFNKSTDFFGRIIIYRLEILNEV